MYYNIKEKYSWPNLYTDIKNYTKECLICLKAGYEKINTMNKIIYTKEKNEIWQVDLIGYLDLTKKKNRYLLVAVEHYTKWIEAAPINNKDASTITKLINSLILEKHGIPKCIISDNGLEFANKEVENLALERKFEWKFNSPGNHSSVGAIERANQTLLNKIKKLSNFGEINWDTVIEQAVNAYNMSYNRSISMSPYALTNYKFPHFEVDKQFNIKQKHFKIKDLKEKRDKQFKKYAKKHIEKGKIKCFNNLRINDKVLIFRKQLGRKLKNHWMPGFIIKGKINDDSYIVENGNTKLRASKKHLKLDTSNFSEGVSQ